MFIYDATFTLKHFMLTINKKNYTSSSVIGRFVLQCTLGVVVDFSLLVFMSTDTRTRGFLTLLSIFVLMIERGGFNSHLTLSVKVK